MSASGTCSSESSGSATASLRQVITIPAASAKASVEKTARWTPSRSPFPVIWEITTFAPIEIPMKNVTMKPMMGVLLPTAAIASFPTNCPMMMVSMVLNTCCSMPVSARSSAKRIVSLPIGPCVISIFFIYTSYPAGKGQRLGGKGKSSLRPEAAGWPATYISYYIIPDNLPCKRAASCQDRPLAL